MYSTTVTTAAVLIFPLLLQSIISSQMRLRRLRSCRNVWKPAIDHKILTTDSSIWFTPCVVAWQCLYSGHCNGNCSYSYARWRHLLLLITAEQRVKLPRGEMRYRDSIICSTCRAAHDKSHAMEVQDDIDTSVTLSTSSSSASTLVTPLSPILQINHLRSINVFSILLAKPHHAHTNLHSNWNCHPS